MCGRGVPFYRPGLFALLAGFLRGRNRGVDDLLVGHAVGGVTVVDRRAHIIDPAFCRRPCLLHRLLGLHGRFRADIVGTARRCSPRLLHRLFGGKIDFGAAVGPDVVVTSGCRPPLLHLGGARQCLKIRSDVVTPSLRAGIGGFHLRQHLRRRQIRRDLDGFDFKLRPFAQSLVAGHDFAVGIA